MSPAQTEVNAGFAHEHEPCEDCGSPRFTLFVAREALSFDANEPKPGSRRHAHRVKMMPIAESLATTICPQCDGIEWKGNAQ